MNNPEAAKSKSVVKRKDIVPEKDDIEATQTVAKAASAYKFPAATANGWSSDPSLLPVITPATLFGHLTRSGKSSSSLSSKEDLPDHAGIPKIAEPRT